MTDISYDIMDEDNIILEDNHSVSSEKILNGYSLPKVTYIDLESQNIDIFDNDNEYNNEYTDGQFITKLNNDLELFRDSINKQTSALNSLSNSSSDFSFFDDYYLNSNSPISMSPSGSCSNSDSESGNKSDCSQNSQTRNKKGPRFKRLTFNEIEQSLTKYYNSENNCSSELDILVTYLKGQKNVYIQSKNISQIKLNTLIIPVLLCTAALTIIAPFMYDYKWGGGLIASMNALITLFISLINYFKLESTTEMYLYLSNQYDKLETTLELTNNKLFFIKEDEQVDLVLQKIKLIENKLTDIKDSTSVFIPEVIKYMFPVICHINIFSFIKQIEIYKKNLIINFKDVKNEIRYILFKWKIKKITDVHKKNINNNVEFSKEKNRLIFLMKTKEKIKDELIHYKSAYRDIDEIFTREIKNAESIKNWFRIIFLCKTNKVNYQYTNPVINNYLKVIFDE